MSLRLTINIKWFEGQELGIKLNPVNEIIDIDQGPGKAAGLSMGDQVVSVNGMTVKVNKENSARELIEASKESSLRLGMMKLGLKRMASTANEKTLGGIVGFSHALNR